MSKMSEKAVDDRNKQRQRVGLLAVNLRKRLRKEGVPNLDEEQARTLLRLLKRLGTKLA